MDRSYTAAEELFRAELRTWLEANIPARWTEPGYWASLDTTESFSKRREWEARRCSARPTSTASGSPR